MNISYISNHLLIMGCIQLFFYEMPHMLRFRHTVAFGKQSSHIYISFEFI